MKLVSWSTEGQRGMTKLVVVYEIDGPLETVTFTHYGKEERPEDAMQEMERATRRFSDAAVAIGCRLRDS